MVLVAAILGAAASDAGPVNIPYPFSPDEAARDFLRLVDELRPKPWTAGSPDGPGPFVVVGTLQAKTLIPDGSAVLMIKLADGQCVLVKSPSALPEIAIAQRLYLVVDFMGEDGSAAARLRGIVLACDLKGRRASLDAMLGIKSTETAGESGGGQPAGGQSGQRTPTAGTGRPAGQVPQNAAAAGQTGTWARAAGGTGQPAGAKQTQPANLNRQAGSAQLWSATAQWPSQPYISYPGWQGTGQPPAQGQPPMPQPGAGVARPGALQPPVESPEERYRVQYWTAYVRERNPKLSEAEAEAIVRWVLYYSAYYGVDHRLIFAVMRYESDFNPNCVSHAGAIGLMQLMPGTARELGVNPWVIEENIRGGIAELAGYLDKYADRPNYEQTILALACYNAGPNAVKRAGGVPQITETINYVQRVADLFYRFVKNGAP